MSTLYVDLSTGNDTTGNGSVAFPFLTVNRALQAPAAPHEIRVAKTPEPIIITANTLWTINSTSLSAARDLTSEIVIGEYIGKPSASGNGCFETYYRVNNITSTTITLDQKYWGSTEIISSEKLIRPVTTGVATTTTYTVTISTANTFILGGWDLALSAQNGETWVKPYGSRSLSNANSYMFFITNHGPNISKMNIVDAYACVYYNVVTAACQNPVITNSTLLAAAYGLHIGIGQGGISSLYQNVIFSAASYCAYIASSVGSCYYANFDNVMFLGSAYGTYGSYTYYTTYKDCLFFAQTNVIIGNPANAANDKYLGINKCYYNSSTWCYQPPAGSLIENFEFYNFANALNPTTNSTVRNCKFENGTGSAIQSVDGARSIYIYNCNFKNVGHGCYNYRADGIVLDSCYFDSCTYGIRNGDSYSGPSVVRDCHFNAPTTWALRKESSSRYMEVINCSIDGASIAKAYSDATPSYFNCLFWIFKNSFGLNGTMWGCGGKFQDYTNFRTTAPGLAITWNATTSKNNMPMKVMSTMINSGASATFNMYIKTANAAWIGTLDPVWRLNESVIKSETRVLSTDLSTTWQLCSWSMASSYITADGELSLEFVPNMNTYSLYLDDFTVT